MSHMKQPGNHLAGDSNSYCYYQRLILIFALFCREVGNSKPGITYLLARKKDSILDSLAWI
jgi:hypothetical protein